MRRNYSQAQIKRTTHITRTIGDYSNLLILFELTNFGEKSFNELKRMTDINSVTLTKKLKILREEGYVGVKEVGNEHHYFIKPKTKQLTPIIKEIESLVLKSS